MRKSSINEKNDTIVKNNLFIFPVLDKVLDSITLYFNKNWEIKLLLCLLDILEKDNHQKFLRGDISEFEYQKNMELYEETYQSYKLLDNNN